MLSHRREPAAPGGIIAAMTDRLPIVDGAPACPFVAFEDDRDARALAPDHRHRCFAEPRPAPRALAHQEAYCLSSAFPVCPTFQDWARREAAAARPAPAGDRAALEEPPVSRPLPPREREPRHAQDGDTPPPIPPRRHQARDWAAPPPWSDEGPGGSGAGARRRRSTRGAGAVRCGEPRPAPAGGMRCGRPRHGRAETASRASRSGARQPAGEDATPPPFLAGRTPSPDDEWGPAAAGWLAARRTAWPERAMTSRPCPGDRRHSARRQRRGGVRGPGRRPRRDVWPAPPPAGPRRPAAGVQPSDAPRRAGRHGTGPPAQGRGSRVVVRAGLGAARRYEAYPPSGRGWPAVLLETVDRGRRAGPRRRRLFFVGPCCWAWAGTPGHRRSSDGGRERGGHGLAEPHPAARADAPGYVVPRRPDVPDREAVRVNLEQLLDANPQFMKNPDRDQDRRPAHDPRHGANELPEEESVEP